MSRIIPKAPPTRHREIVGSFGSGGFIATRDRRTAIPKPQAKPRATRDAAVKATATLTKMTAGAASITARMQDTDDSLSRIADGLRTIADRRRANAPSDGIHRFGTSGAVQAANAARWGR